MIRLGNSPSDYMADLYDALRCALLALHITKSTPDHGHHLRVYPYGLTYARLIDPNGAVGLGQRTPKFLTFFEPDP